MTTRRLAALGAALVWLAGSGVPDSAAFARQVAPPPAPSLVVVVVVDQMRSEYLDRHARFWTAGFKRLLAEGAVFERAFYPYLNTVTCAGHATIATGAYPYRHGVILNEWYHRSVSRRLPCTNDPGVRSIPYAPPPESVGHSAHRLRVPTLADRLRDRSADARVVALSMKPRSTVMLAGREGTAITWFGDNGRWATSSAFAPRPVPEVQAFLDANPVERYRETVWDRVRPAGEYEGEDASASEAPRRGWTSTFPHPLAGAPGTPEAQFYDLWERSPFSDVYLGQMAAHLVRAFRLGQRHTVDFLGISFSGLDYVGHDFGPDSHEVQDALARLDTTLGELLQVLDSAVGRDRYVLALTSDHGVSRIPEAVRAEGTPAGRVLNDEVRKVAEAAMASAHGPGAYVAHVEYTNLYLTEAARTRAERDPTFLQPLLGAVARMDGVMRVLPGRTLTARLGSEDPYERAAALSHHPEESGDVVVMLDPHWIGTNTSAATHGSAHAYDQHVPVVFMGAPFVPGRYSLPASPADVAPTLGATVRLPLPDADGRVLEPALRR